MPLVSECVWCQGPLDGEKALCKKCREVAESEKLVREMGCHLGRCPQASGMHPHVMCSEKYSSGHLPDNSMYSCRGVRSDYYTFVCLDCGSANDYDCARD